MPRSRPTRIRRGAAAVVLAAAALGASTLPAPAQGSADAPREMRRLVADVRAPAAKVVDA